MSERYTKFIAGKLQKSGFENIQILSPNEEISADIIATSKSGAKVCIKCCYSTQPVTAIVVQAVLQAKRSYKCNASMIVTNNTFTDKAKAYAAENKTVLKEEITIPQPSVNTAPSSNKKNNASPKRNLIGILAVLALLLIVLIPIGIHLSTEPSNPDTEESAAASEMQKLSENNISNGEKTSGSENNPDVSDSTEEAFTELEAIGDISVDEGLFSVEITVPADFVGDTTQAELDAAVQENGYKSATLNTDGSATYVMTQKQHNDMMEELRENFKQQLNEMVGSEDFPNFVKIEANDNFTRFEVTTKSTELNFMESFSTLQFYMISGAYNTFNGTTVDNCSVIFINEQTGEIISEANSSEMGD